MKYSVPNGLGRETTRKPGKTDPFARPGTNCSVFFALIWRFLSGKSMSHPLEPPFQCSLLHDFNRDSREETHRSTTFLRSGLTFLLPGCKLPEYLDNQVVCKTTLHSVLISLELELH